MSRELNILVAPDKFKGTLTAEAAARAISRGWQKARPHDQLTLLPMSDGGDGFGEIMSRLAGARVQKTNALDAAHRPCKISWWWEPHTKTAIIESARIIGLAMLPPGKFHPFDLDTFGLGAAFRAAAGKGARRCLVGIGGSATNDGGFGLARAMGWDFLDNAGQEIEQWPNLTSLETIRPPRETPPAPNVHCAPESDYQGRARLSSARRHRNHVVARRAEDRRALPWFQEVIVAVDVRNPLLGPRGATRIYGPQKGLRARDFEKAEHCLSRLAKVWKNDFGKDFSRAPGAGAAGGLGFGLLAFLGARLMAGFDLFADYARLAQRLRSADLVITGEGAIDQSTLMGKGVGQLALGCLKAKVPCIGLAGSTRSSARIERAFTQVRALAEIATVKDAKADAQYWLERLSARLAWDWKC